MKKTRLDQWLLAQGLCDSRTLAQRFIQAGQVFVDGQRIDKVATKISQDARVEVKALPRYVSRGGEKLEAALRQFSISTTDKICLDTGASTGGFTDCLLQHGAVKVYAVDVGKNQLHWRLRHDPRVVVLEQLNARALSGEHVPELVDLITIDVSFISLSKVLPAAVPLLKPEGELITLVKPQFEAGPDRVGRGGVVKDPQVHEDVLRRVAEFARETLGFDTVDATFSPLKGPAGNIEFFLHLRRDIPCASRNLQEVVQAAHRAWEPFGSTATRLKPGSS